MLVLIFKQSTDRERPPSVCSYASNWSLFIQPAIRSNYNNIQMQLLFHFKHSLKLKSLFVFLSHYLRTTELAFVAPPATEKVRSQNAG